MFLPIQTSLSMEDYTMSTAQCTLCSANAEQNADDHMARAHGSWVAQRCRDKCADHLLDRKCDAATEPAAPIRVGESEFDNVMIFLEEQVA
jgi:hypothetical protein